MEQKKLSKDSKSHLKELGFALDQRNFKSALDYQVKLAGSKDWKKHKNWIKPLKFCIELAKKKFAGKKRKLPVLGTGRPEMLVRNVPSNGESKVEGNSTASKSGESKTGESGANSEKPVPRSNPPVNQSQPPMMNAQRSSGPPATSSPRNLNYSQNIDGLIHACKRNDTDTVKNLLKSINPNEKGVNGNYALHEAAAAGSLQAVKVLLDAKANPLLKNGSNNTALDVAMNTMMTMNNPSQELIDTVDLLERSSANAPLQQVDLSSPNKQGGNPAPGNATDKGKSGWFW